MIFIGDVHRNFKSYLSIVEHAKRESLQLGDLGIGFPMDRRLDKRTLSTHPEAINYTDCRAPKGHLFIRGNHDNPEKCRKHPNYIGDYGVHKEELFFVSGAWSIDRAFRTKDINWWADEELTYQELQDAIDMYKISFPRIVATHDCPHCINRILYPYSAKKSKTSRAFDSMLDEYRPSLWIFGHHHKSINIVYEGTRFIGLKELEILDIEEDTRTCPSG